MKFYKVVYAVYKDNVQSRNRYSYKDWLVEEWCKKNCQAPYYHNPGWTTEKFIEFENSEDAVHFALRWA